VLIFVKYQLNQGKTARRYPERDRDLEQHLTDDPLKGYNSLSGKVLPVLHMVKLGEAKSWLAHPEILKYYDGDELGAQSPRIEQLFVNVEEMPMRDLVPKLAEVLDLCRRIA